MRSTFTALVGLLICAALAWTSTRSRAADAKPDPVVGRWDVTITQPDGVSYPSWFEISRSGATLVGQFVGRFGSARPVARFQFDENSQALRFTVPPQFEQRTDDQVFEAVLKDGVFHGDTTDEQGKALSWVGSPAPKLVRSAPVSWGTPLQLFNGKDLSGWKPRDSQRPNGWKVRDGLLENVEPGNDLVSEQLFTDFKVDAEFKYPAGSNSGIYLRGRYEVQIEDNFGGEPDSHRIGGVYGFLHPRINAAKPAGEWQTISITLVGREVTIVLNGETVVSQQNIPGITGGALNASEGEPGPLFIQGDHGPIAFRKLVVTPAK